MDIRNSSQMRVITGRIKVIKEECQDNDPSASQPGPLQEVIEEIMTELKNRRKDGERC